MWLYAGLSDLKHKRKNSCFICVSVGLIYFRNWTVCVTQSIGFTFSYLPNVAIYLSTVRKSVWSGQMVC